MVHTSSSNVWASRWKCFHFTSLIVYIFGRMMMILEDFFWALWTGLPKTTTDYCVAASEIRYTRHASALGYLNVWAYGIHAGLHVRCTFVDCWELVEPVRSFGEYPLRFFFRHACPICGVNKRIRMLCMICIQQPFRMHMQIKGNHFQKKKPRSARRWLHRFTVGKNRFRLCPFPSPFQITASRWPI